VFFDEVDQGYCGYHTGSCNFSLFDKHALQMANNAMLTQVTRVAVDPQVLFCSP
jgi:hypothetical protein